MEFGRVENCCVTFRRWRKVVAFEKIQEDSLSVFRLGILDWKLCPFQFSAWVSGWNQIFPNRFSVTPLRPLLTNLHKAVRDFDTEVSGTAKLLGPTEPQFLFVIATEPPVHRQMPLDAYAI